MCPRAHTHARACARARMRVCTCAGSPDHIHEPKDDGDIGHLCDLSATTVIVWFMTTVVVWFRCAAGGMSLRCMGDVYACVRNVYAMFCAACLLHVRCVRAARAMYVQCVGDECAMCVTFLAAACLASVVESIDRLEGPIDSSIRRTSKKPNAATQTASTAVGIESTSWLAKSTAFA